MQTNRHPKHKVAYLTIVASALIVSNLPAAIAKQVNVEYYPPTPLAEFDRTVLLTVEGRPVQLESSMICNPAYSPQRHISAGHARLAADGPVNVELQFKGTTPQRAYLRTVGKDLTLALIAQKLSFQLLGPGHYYLQLPDLAKPNGTYVVLFWIDDLGKLRQTRLRLDDPNIIDVTTQGAMSHPTKDQTAVLQSIFNKGGTIHFPAGIYRSGTLRIGSNTTLYLAPGTILKAADNPNSLADQFLLIADAHNVKIAGQGTINANGLAYSGKMIHNVNIENCSNVTFEDVLFENSISWAIHIRKSDLFTARNVKVFSGKDGFDPDSSRDVLLENVFVASIDDAIAVKNRFGKATERITVRNAIVCSTKSSLKIGTETRGPITHVLFESCDIFDGERGIVLYARDCGPIERATWRNIRMFLIDWPQEKISGAAFHLTIDYRDGSKVPTTVRNCAIENVTANFLYRSEFAGLPDAPLNGIEMRNIALKVDPPKKGKPYLFECRNNVKMTIKNLTIDWQRNRDKWAGIAHGPGLLLKELKEL